jgi:ABC-type iron transport system FetAB permease component
VCAHARCIVQLTVLGYILVPIFTYNMWWLVLLYAFFMLFIGCLEAVQRPQYSYHVSLAVLCSNRH